MTNKSSAVPAISIQNLSHQYDTVQALNDVTFSVPAGGLFGLLGPNGSGKSTLFKIISTLLKPTAGQVEVTGHNTMTDADEVRKDLGVIFQQPALDLQLTIRENLTVHAALYGMSGRRAKGHIDEVLKMVDLTDRADDRVKTLSGGLARRADLARGLIHNPKILLLDEPTTGLDPIARRSLWDHLKKMRHEHNTTMIIATHLMEEAESCDHLAILDEGKLVAYDTPANLKAQLGGETLWLESTDPPALKKQLEDKFDLKSRIIGSLVHVSSQDATQKMADIYASSNEIITSATLRKPSLEDVFMIHAGHALNESSTDEITA